MLFSDLFCCMFYHCELPGIIIVEGWDINAEWEKNKIGQNERKCSLSLYEWKCLLFPQGLLRISLLVCVFWSVLGSWSDGSQLEKISSQEIQTDQMLLANFNNVFLTLNNWNSMFSAFYTKCAYNNPRMYLYSSLHSEAALEVDVSIHAMGRNTYSSTYFWPSFPTPPWFSCVKFETCL